MSGASMMPHSLTGGAGYKANASYDEFLRKHSSFYRRHSAASNAQEEDRRASRSSAGINEDAARAVANVEAENARRGSGQLHSATGGAAVANDRRGSQIVASDSTRRDSLLGMEATAGTTMDPNRRGSTSLAGDLYRKIKHKE